LYHGLRVTETDFIKSPERYLEELGDEPIHITRDGWELAVLARPGNTKKSRRLLHWAIFWPRELPEKASNIIADEENKLYFSSASI